MTGFRSPTVIAALVIAVSALLTVLIASRALKRFGRGLTEMARAVGTLSAELKNHNQIATTVAGHQNDLEQIRPMVTEMDAFLKRWGPVIPGIDTYLQQVDGERYLAAMSGGAAVPPPPQEFELVPVAEATPLQEVPLAAMPVTEVPGQAVIPLTGVTSQMQMGPNPRYPKLPFDPENEASIEQYLVSLLPEGRTLNEAMPKDAAQGYGANYTWRQWACARVNMEFGDLLNEYRLPTLGSDLSMTMGFRRVEIPGEQQNND